MKRKVDDISLILNTSDRVTLSVTIVFIVISLIIAVINVEGIRQKEIDEIEKYLSVRTIEGAEKVDAYFSNKLTELELIASFQEIYTMDWEKQYPILKYNAQKLRYSDLFVIDNNGIGYYSEDNAKRNQKEEQFFYNINKNEQYITEPFSQVGRGKAITTLSTAIYNDGNRVGTLCGTINLDYLYEYIKYDTVKESEYGFIINQNGQYVANNDLSLVYDKVNIFEQDGYEVEFLKNQEKNNYGSIKVDGKEYYASYTTLENIPWRVIFVISKNSVLNEVKSIKILNYITIGFFMILMLLVTSIIIRFIKNHRMVYIDTLTGIYNRNKCEYLFSKFENDYTKDVVIISIDLNDFKYINDTYGHQVGDKALCTFIDILKNYFPRETFIGRMGGDEFIVVLENISEYRINLMLDNMYNGIKEYNEKSLEKFKLSAAYGYAIRKKGKKVSIKDIYKKADENMYSNKYGR